MKGETHVTIGVATTTALMTSGVLAPGIMPVVAAVIGSLLPDIDHNNSSINNRLMMSKGAYILLAAGLLYYSRQPLTYVAAAILLLIGFSRHRAITHSLVALVGLYVLTGYFSDAIQIGVMVGYAMHLVADFFTKQGIELLFPYGKNFRSPLTISTGNGIEYLVSAAALLSVIYNGVQIFKAGWPF
jgi:inner membrane protein